MNATQTTVLRRTMDAQEDIDGLTVQEEKQESTTFYKR